MARFSWWKLLILAIACAFSGRPTPAQDAKDQALFQDVLKRLLATDLARKEYPDKYSWPPAFFIKANSANELNAYASGHQLHGATVDPKTGKTQPVLMITEGYLKTVVKGDASILAVIMGHEFGHIVKDHIGNRPGKTDVLFLAFNRDQEIEADLEGMRYAVAAGFPYKSGIASAFREMKLGTRYTSFEGLQATHPTWEERLAFLDRKQSRLWSAMSAFQDGRLFLDFEQYLAAEQCFSAVTKEFPDCADAWGNLGYAQLMRYCDGLEPDDIRRLGIGQIVAGAFYARPSWLESKIEPPRAFDEKLWKAAVKNLTKSLERDGNQVLPRANLGLAYLVHYESSDPEQAVKWYAEAYKLCEKDKNLDPLNVAALLVNSAVGDLALGKSEQAAAKLKIAQDLSATLKLTSLVRTLEDALLYNRALLGMASNDPEQKRRAFADLESYLILSSPDSGWWPLAHKHYVKLGKELTLEPLAEATLRARAEPKLLRLLTAVQLPGGATLTLGEPVAKAAARLGEDRGTKVPVSEGAKIYRIRFAEQGVDILGKDKVLAIFLSGPKAPVLKLQTVGVTGAAREIRIGMSEADLNDVLKDQRADLALRSIDTTKNLYRFYPEMGLAVRFAAGRVAEFALAQIPRRSFVP